MNSESKCPQCGAVLSDASAGGLCASCLLALNLSTETAPTTPRNPLPPPLSPSEIALLFPQLEILECLGRGGMGVVYKVRQTALQRLAALKLLAPERVRDPRFAERFTREARALAALDHPNIVTIYDFGQANETYYLLMEYVDGMDLRHLLREHRLSAKEALAIVPALCDALQFAHDRGIVHRDIKPENLLLDKSGIVKIADFGIARMLGGPLSDPPSEAVRGAGATLNALGTPGYSAPEQGRTAANVDHRADIYSLGVVLYEMLTGELPGKPIEVPSRKVHVDVRLDEIVLRALEVEPELRFQQASEIKTEVESITSSPPTLARATNIFSTTDLPVLVQHGGHRRIYWPGVLMLFSTVGLGVSGAILLLAILLALFNAPVRLTFHSGELGLMALLMTGCVVMRFAALNFGTVAATRRAAAPKSRHLTWKIAAFALAGAVAVSAVFLARYVVEWMTWANFGQLK